MVEQVLQGHLRKTEFYLNRTICQGCGPSETFTVRLVVATSSAPDCASHSASVVFFCSFIQLSNDDPGIHLVKTRRTFLPLPGERAGVRAVGDQTI